jgi:hypothetical protein
MQEWFLHLQDIDHNHPAKGVMPVLIPKDSEDNVNLYRLTN